MQHEENTTDQSEDQQNAPIAGGIPLETDSKGNIDISSEGGKPNPGLGYYIFGVITIIFGIIVGIYLLVELSQTGTTLFSSDPELTLTEFMISVAGALIFIASGVISIGIGKVLNMLDTASTKIDNKEKEIN